MFLIIKTIHNFLKLLNSETAPSQLAAGVSFGMIVGLTPFLSLHNLFIFLIVCLFRVNFSMFFLSMGVFSILSFALDPLFDGLGYLLLVNVGALRPLWIFLSTGPILPFFRFNNTIVLGSLVFSLIFLIPTWVVSVSLVKHYRETWAVSVKNSKLMKALRATPIYGLYEKYENLKAKFSLT